MEALGSVLKAGERLGTLGHVRGVRGLSATFGDILESCAIGAAWGRLGAFGVVWGRWVNV